MKSGAKCRNWDSLEPLGGHSWSSAMSPFDRARTVIVIFIKHICKGLIMLIGLFRVKLS